MTKEFSYSDFVTDEKFLSEYNAYQEKYAATIRESDRVIVELVLSMVSKVECEKTIRLLDIGCSTGNLLMHLKNMVPGLALYGGDLAQSSLDVCRANQDLAGITFQEMNVLQLGAEDFYDIIVVNAVIYMLSDDEMKQALPSIFTSLRQGGQVILFDFCHPFEQNIVINEISRTHPEGLNIHFRPEKIIREAFIAAGFSDLKISPFQLPVDLPQHEDNGELITYTVKSEHGERMAFRGILLQPWCHMTARKPF